MELRIGPISLAAVTFRMSLRIFVYFCMNKNPSGTKSSSHSTQNTKQESPRSFYLGQTAGTYLQDPVTFAKISQTCGLLVSSSRVANYRPGYEAGDLLAEVVTRISEKRCPTVHSFFGLFHITAKRHIISIILTARRRRRHVSPMPSSDLPEYDDEALSVLEFHAASQQSEQNEKMLICRDLLELLSKIPLKHPQRPVFEAILEEALTGHRVPDHEVANDLGATPNKIRKIRRTLRQKLSHSLKSYWAEGLPEGLQPKAKSCSRLKQNI